MKNMINKVGDNKNTKNFFQFVKFGIVGLSNTIVSYVIYTLSLLEFQKRHWFLEIDYLVAQFLGFVISVLWSFYWNRKYVFKANGENVAWPMALLKMYISYGFTGIFMNSVLSVIWVRVLDISKMFAPLINLLVSVPLNFLMNKFWAFSEKKS